MLFYCWVRWRRRVLFFEELKSLLEFSSKKIASYPFTRLRAGASVGFAKRQLVQVAA